MSCLRRLLTLRASSVSAAWDLGRYLVIVVYSKSCRRIHYDVCNNLMTVYDICIRVYFGKPGLQPLQNPALSPAWPTVDRRSLTEASRQPATTFFARRFPELAVMEGSYVKKSGK